MFEEILQLKSALIPLAQIYLDPNNPRFSEDDRPKVSDEHIDQKGLQGELMSKMEINYAVDRLKDSMENNGYLPIDRIVVREFKEEKYVVLEGNRRITAAKRLIQQDKDGDIELTDEVRKTIENIPSLIYYGRDEDAAWVFQGLRHISGIKDWSAYNKAKLLVDQMEEKDLNYTEAGKIFGISAWAAAQRARGYYGYLEAKNHRDFHNDVNTKSFPYFQELFGRSNVALKEDWLEWDDEDKDFKNEENFAEFLSWLYPKFDDQGEYDPDLPGDWEKRWIPRAIDLRDVTKLFSNYPEEFRSFRLPDVSLSTAMGRATAKEEQRRMTVSDYVNYFIDFQENVERLPFVSVINENRQEEIIRRINELISVLETSKNMLETTMENE